MRALGWLLVTGAMGCAAARSTAVPVEPVAGGRATELSSYDLMLGQAPAGRMLFGAGGAMRDANGRQIVRVGVRVENESSQIMRLPMDQLFLAGLGGRQIEPFEINGAQPGALEVPPGSTRTFDVAFVLPGPLRIDDVRTFELHWALDLDGARIARATPFVAIERGRRYGPQLATGGSPMKVYDVPNFPRDRFNTAGASPQRDAGRARRPFLF